jgi:hypothetical protein
MGLPPPNWESILTVFFTAVLFACALAVLVWIAMDWYENRRF